jgi:hypothetical protein
MNIDFVWVENETKDKIATAKINYNKNNIKFAFQANSDYETYEWMWEWKVFEESLDIKSQFASKEYLNDKLTTQMSGNLNLMYDVQSPNNNISLFVDLNQSQENIWSLKIEYRWKKEFKENIIIEAPKNVSDIEVMSEQKKIARDTKRVSEIKWIQTWIEQYYWDNAEYPDMKDFDNILSYMAKIPYDEYAWKTIDWCEFGYKYWVTSDENDVKNQVYQLSTCMESPNSSNLISWDGWFDNKRFEVWIFSKKATMEFISK